MRFKPTARDWMARLLPVKKDSPDVVAITQHVETVEESALKVLLLTPSQKAKVHQDVVADLQRTPNLTTRLRRSHPKMLTVLKSPAIKDVAVTERTTTPTHPQEKHL